LDRTEYLRSFGAEFSDDGIEKHGGEENRGGKEPYGGEHDHGDAQAHGEDAEAFPVSQYHTPPSTFHDKDGTEVLDEHADTAARPENSNPGAATGENVEHVSGSDADLDSADEKAYGEIKVKKAAWKKKFFGVV
jgi:hypothetical protein